MTDLINSLLKNIGRYPLLKKDMSQKGGELYLDQLNDQDWDYIKSKVARAFNIPQNEAMLLFLKKPDAVKVTAAINSIPDMIREVEAKGEQERVVDIFRKATTKEGDPKRSQITWDKIKQKTLSCSESYSKNIVGIANSEMADLLKCIRD